MLNNFLAFIFLQQIEELCLESSRRFCENSFVTSMVVTENFQESKAAMEFSQNRSMPWLSISEKGRKKARCRKLPSPRTSLHKITTIFQYNDDIYHILSLILSIAIREGHVVESSRHRGRRPWTTEIILKGRMKRLTAKGRALHYPTHTDFPRGWDWLARLTSVGLVAAIIPCTQW